MRHRHAVFGFVAAALLWALPGAASLVPSFGVPSTYPVPARPYHTVVRDMNGDGRPDIAISCDGSGQLSLYLANTYGTFAGRIDYPAIADARGLAAGDFNEDGRIDLVTASESGSQAAVLFNAGNAQFSQPSLVSTASNPSSVLAGDLNGDGHLDLAVGCESGVLTVLLGNGQGTFTRAADYPIGAMSLNACMGDLNGDGKLDVVTANTAGSVTVLLGRGDGTFASGVDYPMATGCWTAVIADFNGDGVPDIASSNSGAASVTVRFGVGDGTFAGLASYGTGPYPYSLAAGDLNGDGASDIAVTNDGTTHVQVLTNNGNGTFAAAMAFEAGVSSVSMNIAELNDDGRPDLVVGSLSNSVIVMYNTTTPPPSPSTTTLSLDLNPSTFGQVVTLTASVAPSSATGFVQFFDGGTLLGRTALSGGSTTFPVSSLVHGDHVLFAHYLGNIALSPSDSPTQTLHVDLAATSVVIGSSANPSYEGVATTFTANVTVLPPGQGVPTGSVQFLVDGTNTGVPVLLTSGSATSAPVTSLGAGHHAVVAAYLPADTFSCAPSSSAALDQVVTGSAPAIVAVRDVPNDQGGRVFLTWSCTLDRPDFHDITGYRIWRRVPPGALSAQGLRALPARRADGTLEPTYWEEIANLHAAQLMNYGFTAPTTQDSLPDSNPYTAFLVQALTTDPLVWFDSPPDSGYSVDNLVPPAPASFVAEYHAGMSNLHWTASRAPDVSFYRLYRGYTVDFVPGPTSLIGTLTDTTFADPTGSEVYCYKLAAVDVHGNTGRYAIITPSGATATLATFLTPVLGDGSVDLGWYVSTMEPYEIIVQRRGVEDGWSALGPVAVDGLGYARYHDTSVVPGARYGYRLLLRAPGVTDAFAGEGWIDVPVSGSTNVFAASPVSAGPVRVSLVATGTRPVPVELYDLSGRRVTALSVAGGLGRVNVEVADASSLTPGVYLLRVGLETPVVRRVVVIR